MSPHDQDSWLGCLRKCIYCIRSTHCNLLINFIIIRGTPFPAPLNFKLRARHNVGIQIILQKQAVMIVYF